MGKFHRLLEPGLNFLVPLIDRIKYVKSMKETAVEVPSQSAITQGKYILIVLLNCMLLNVFYLLDNVTLELDGVLYFRVIDPFKVSYNAEQYWQTNATHLLMNNCGFIRRAMELKMPSLLLRS